MSGLPAAGIPLPSSVALVSPASSSVALQPHGPLTRSQSIAHRDRAAEEKVRYWSGTLLDRKWDDGAVRARASLRSMSVGVASALSPSSAAAEEAAPFLRALARGGMETARRGEVFQIVASSTQGAASSAAVSVAGLPSGVELASTVDGLRPWPPSLRREVEARRRTESRNMARLLGQAAEEAAVSPGRDAADAEARAFFDSMVRGMSSTGAAGLPSSARDARQTAHAGSMQVKDAVLLSAGVENVPHKRHVRREVSRPHLPWSAGCQTSAHPNPSPFPISFLHPCRT